MPEFKTSIEAAYKLINEKNIAAATHHTIAYFQLLTNMFGIFNTDTIEHATLLANLFNASGLKDESKDMMKLVIKIQEKLNGLDSYGVIEGMKILAKYHMENKDINSALNLHLKCLYLNDIIGGDLNLNSFTSLEDIQFLYYENKNIECCIQTCQEKLKRYSVLYEKNQIHLIHV